MLKVEYPDFQVLVMQRLIPLAVFDIIGEDDRTRVDVHIDEDVSELHLLGLVLIAARALYPPPHMQVKLDAMLMEIEETLRPDPEEHPF